MDRLFYLSSLLVLQAALIGDVVPWLAEFIRATAALGEARDGTAVSLRFLFAGIAAIGSTPVLGAPAIAFLRHWQRGGLRFLGLPRWGRWTTVIGAASYSGICILGMFPAVVEVLVDGSGIAGALPVGTPHDAAIALMCGGALAAELLRRSVAPPLRLCEVMPVRNVQVQVIHPDALRGQTATG